MATTREKRCGTTAIEATHDQFVYKLDCIEMIGCGQLRATFLCKLNGEDGEFFFAPADFAVIMPVTSLPDAIGKALMAMGRNIYTFTDGSLTVAI